MELTFTSLSLQVIAGCINKDRNYQKKLYNLISPVIYTQILRDGYSEKDAEEMLQKVMIEIFACIGKYDRQGLFEDWWMQVYKRIQRSAF